MARATSVMYGYRVDQRILVLGNRVQFGMNEVVSASIEQQGGETHIQLVRDLFGALQTVTT